MYKNIMFDLDGTVTDSGRAIMSSVEYALDKNECVMIGDTKFDIKGASEAGVDSIAVTYGYGKVEEMKEAGATYIADSAQAVAGFLGVSI